MMLRYTIDPERIAANRRRNFVHAIVLIGALALLLAVVGWFIAGMAGLLWIAAFAILVLYFGPQVSQKLMLQVYSATPLTRRQVPFLYDVVDELCSRAGIEPRVSLFYIPSRLMLAFTVGSREDTNIALSDGLLRRLSGREIAGVIAHELSHLAHGDLKLMALADFITKVTRMLAFIAMLLIAINLPYIAEGNIAIPWPPIVLLAFAPLLTVLLQLGLSRSREYDADAGAALLTGDPEGIASALQKMDAQQQRYWETVFGRQGVLNQPSILRTHPHTDERVHRLAEMAKPHEDVPELPDDVLPDDHAEVRDRPRRRFHGFRY